MAKNNKIKEEVKQEGKSIRVSDASYAKIRDFCKERGYKIGAFMEKATLSAIDRITNNSN